MKQLRSTAWKISISAALAVAWWCLVNYLIIRQCAQIGIQCLTDCADGILPALYYDCCCGFRQQIPTVEFAWQLFRFSVPAVLVFVLLHLCDLAFSKWNATKKPS